MCILIDSIVLILLRDTTNTKQTSTPEVRLVARVARNVDSLDVDLFLQALALRRQFLASH